MLYWLLRRALRLVVRVYRPSIHGLDNVPEHGAVILACNHLSFIDSMVVPLVVPRRVAFLAKAEYFATKGVKGALIRRLFRTVGAVPVERGYGRAARASLDTAEAVLAKGEAFGIYPEGTRSRDGRLHRGHVGVARLTLATGAPVVPVALSGTDQVQPVGSRIPRIRPITIRFGTPLNFSRYAGMDSHLPILRAVTDEIMAAIGDLSGQEYVDSYQERPAA